MYWRFMSSIKLVYKSRFMNDPKGSIWPRFENLRYSNINHLWPLTTTYKQKKGGLAGLIYRTDKPADSFCMNDLDNVSSL